MIKIAVISNVKEIQGDGLEKMVTAINKQLSLHFAPVWAVESQAVVFQDVKTAKSLGYYPVTIQYEIDEPTLGGYHAVGDDGIPYGLVKYSSRTSYVLSHEIMEIVHNPFLKKFRKTTGYKENEDDPLFVEEVADATDGKGYLIDGFEVSNFITPDWFNKTHQEGIKYDYLDLLSRPRELYEGGYISWMNVQGEYWQAVLTKGKLLYRKLTGQTVASQTKDNPMVYVLGFLGLCAFYLLYRIIKSKPI